MKNKWVSLVKSAVAVACLATASVTAFGMPILVESGGQVIGIDGLVVGAETYDVQFVEGSCDSLFSGCDESLFTFTTLAGSVAAASSILSAFAGHPVDEFPELQFGIQDGSRGLTVIPYMTGEITDRFGLRPQAVALSSVAVNNRQGVADTTIAGTPLTTTNFVLFPLTTYAVFFERPTPVDAPPAVPTPASLLLALFGLAGMCLQHKRQRRQV